MKVCRWRDMCYLRHVRKGGLVGADTARQTETGVYEFRFRGRSKVRSMRPAAALMLAALFVLPATASAQQASKNYVPAPVQARRPLVAQVGGHAAMTEKLNQNTVTVISGNPNGAYLYLAFDMSAVLDSGSDLRVLP